MRWHPRVILVAIRMILRAKPIEFLWVALLAGVLLIVQQPRDAWLLTIFGYVIIVREWWLERRIAMLEKRLGWKT